MLIRKTLFLILVSSFPLAELFAQDSLKVGPSKDSTNSASVIEKKAKDLEKKIRPSGMFRGQLQEIKGKSSLSEIRQTLAPDFANEKIPLLNEKPRFGFDRFSLDGQFARLPEGEGLPDGFTALRDYSSLRMQSSATLAGLPFSAGLNGTDGRFNFDHSSLKGLYHFNFDPHQYMEELRKAVLRKVDPQKATAYLHQKIDDIRHEYEKKFRDEMQSMQSGIEAKGSRLLPIPLNLADLDRSDLASVKDRLFATLTPAKYQEALTRLQELKSNPEIAKKETDSLKRELTALVGQYEMFQMAYGRFLHYKSLYDSNSVVKDLKARLPFTPASFGEYLKDPEHLIGIVRDHADLGSFQQLFMYMKRLDLGKNAVDNGLFSTRQLMNNGVNAQFETKKISGGFIYGSNRRNNNWLQSGLQQFVSNQYSSLTGFKFGTGSGSKVRQSMSLDMYNFDGNTGRNNPDLFLDPDYFSQARRQDAVLTMHSDADLGEAGGFSVDLSRSFGSYSNVYDGDSLRMKTGALQSVLQNNGKSNMAISADYRGTAWNTGFHFAFRKVGLGYNNPGNYFLRRGETAAGFGLRRQGPRQKWRAVYEGEIRSQVFDPAKQYRFRTISNKLDGRFRLSRYSHVSLVLQHSAYKSAMASLPMARGNNFRVQLSGQYRVWVFNRQLLNSSLLTRQQMAYPSYYGEIFQTSAWQFMHSATLLLRKQMLTLSIMTNKSASTEYYFNTSFVNVESSVSYQAGGHLRLNSGLGYYSNTGWNRQLGWKQQLSALFFRNLSIDLNLECRKAVKVIRPEMADQLFVTTGVHYQF